MKWDGSGTPQLQLVYYILLLLPLLLLSSCMATAMAMQPPLHGITFSIIPVLMCMSHHSLLVSCLSNLLLSMFAALHYAIANTAAVSVLLVNCCSLN